MRLLTRANGLRFLLLLFLAASLSYWIVGTRDFLGLWRHPDERIRLPFEFDGDSHQILEITPEAKAAGLDKSEVLEAINGQPYSGFAAFHEMRRAAHPGDIWITETRRPDGSKHQAKIVLQPLDTEHPSFGRTVRLFVLFCLTPLICLLIGYWVVLVKPEEPNAWLLAFLLAFPESGFLNPVLATGWDLALRTIWFQGLQLAGPLLLPLFGLYFPERSRIDVKLPWLKWLILGPGLIAILLSAVTVSRTYLTGAEENWRTAIDVWLQNGFNVLSLLSLLFYAVVIGDKLRTASTADARRRMRLLAIGSGVGLAAALICFAVLPAFGVKPNLLENFWIVYIGTAFFMVAPLTFAYVVLVDRAMDVRILLRAGTKYLLARTGLWVLQAIFILAAGLHLLPPLIEKKQMDPSDVWQALIFVGLVIFLRQGVSKKLEAWIDRKFFREAYDTDLVLRDLSDQVRRFTEAEPLLTTVSWSIAETLHVSRLAVMLRTGADTFALREAVGLEISSDLALSSHSSTIRNLSQRTSAVRLRREEADGWYFLASAKEQEILEKLGAEILLPMFGRNKLMGFMTLGPKKSEAAYTRNDVALLEMVASQTGLALEVSELAHSLAQEAAQRERVHREIEIAREVQEKLFPQELPVIDHASIAGICRPALGVGGDYYDVIQLEDGRIGLAIGDVSGKGISAALLMASLRASLRGATLDAPQDLAKLMEKVSQLVYEASASNRYATFFFGTYDPQSRALQYVNAGHNPPFVLRSNSDVVRLTAGGPVIGLLTHTSYEQQRFVLEPGDLLLAFTDGISEAMSSREEEWGEDRLEAVARRCEGDAREVLREIIQEVEHFTAGEPQYDDMTLLVLKLHT